LDSAAAQDIRTPAEEPEWKKTVRLTVPPLQSPLGDSSTSPATFGAADPRAAASEHRSTHIDDDGEDDGFVVVNGVWNFKEHQELSTG
jgi:hypothetical protein